MTEKQDIERLSGSLIETLEIIDQTVDSTILALYQREEIQEAHAVLAEVSEATRKRDNEETVEDIKAEMKKRRGGAATEALIACHEVLQELHGADFLPFGSDLEVSAVTAIILAGEALEVQPNVAVSIEVEDEAEDEA